jgi:23S rRNA (guanosine2251-2'-O)-methyltransferase
MPSPSRSEFLYGLNPAFEVLRGNRRQISEAFLGQRAKNNPRLQKLATLLEARSVPVQWADRGKLTQIAGSGEHQGAVLAVSPYPYASSHEIFSTNERLLLLDNIEDPQNLGAILRSAEVFGFASVLLPLKGVPGIYPSVVKASAGATEHLRIARDHNAIAYFRAARADGFTVLALDAGGGESLREAARNTKGKILLVIGGEDKSVGRYILNNADLVARICQTGRVNSLNASVAAGVAMHELSQPQG